MKKKNYIKQAEQNVLNNVKYCQDLLQVIDSLNSFVNHYVDDYGERGTKARTAIASLRSVIIDQMNEHISKCFIFTGVGGEEVLEFSREMFKKHFGEDRYVVINFLTRNGRIPHSWQKEEEETFREQCKEKIKQFEK
jgi:hypothetical protein